MRDVSVKKTFYQHITDAFDKLSKDPQSIAFIKVNPSFMHIFNILLKENKFIFDRFEISVNKILEDGKLNVRDIPEIINLLKLVYTTIKNMKLKTVKKEMYAQISLDIVYSIFVICIDQEIIKVNVPKETIKEFLSILVSCNDLIEINTKYKKRWNCFCW